MAAAAPLDFNGFLGQVAALGTVNTDGQGFIAAMARPCTQTRFLDRTVRFLDGSPFLSVEIRELELRRAPNGIHWQQLHVHSLAPVSESFLDPHSNTHEQIARERGAAGHRTGQSRGQRRQDRSSWLQQQQQQLCRLYLAAWPRSPLRSQAAVAPRLLPWLRPQWRSSLRLRALRQHRRLQGW